jgi:ATP-dependent DNA helicase RecQ
MPADRPRIEDLPALLDIEGFWPHQRAAVSAAIEARDSLLITPTASGKTEVAVGAALARGGLTLLLSPLRILMRDQADRVSRLEVIPARVWNSDTPDADRAEIEPIARSGQDMILFGAPEALPYRLGDVLATCRINTVIIDEVHMALTAGRGFRPQYGQLATLLRHLRPGVRIATSATVRASEVGRLNEVCGLTAPEVIRLPIRRSNLDIQVVEREQYELYGILRRHAGQAGLIFCATRKRVMSLAASLRAVGYNAEAYHSKIKKRADVERRFLSGEIDILVTTDAASMGVSRSDVRFTVLYDPSASLTDAIQAAGRAGRDGEQAHAYLALRNCERGSRSREFLLESSWPRLDEVRAAWLFLRNEPCRAMTAGQIGETLFGAYGSTKGVGCINQLRRHGLCGSVAAPWHGPRATAFEARGDFEAADFGQYLADRADTFNQFEALLSLQYFSGDQFWESLEGHFEDLATGAHA